MPPAPVAPELDSERSEWDDSAYRSLSLTAVLGLLFGAAAAAGLWHPVFVLAAAVGVLLSAVALRRIATATPPPVGRAAALAGLALSLVFGVATATAVTYRGVVLENEAQQIARDYFDHLVRGEYAEAHQLSLAETKRARAGDDIWTFYRNDEKAQESLRQFVNESTVRSLTRLGDRARVRHYQTETRETGKGRDTINQVYAVTYDDDGEVRTFFISVKLIHSQDDITRRYGWVVSNPMAGVLPKSWIMEPPAGERAAR